MGRKKKKQSKPWCWYCNREFEDEKILIQHQKAKHFKCHICHKKLYTGPGLSIHCMQVHKEAIDKVPNSLSTRSNIEIEIYGMEGIPPEDLKEHEKQKQGKHGRAASPSSGEDEPPTKKKASEGVGSSGGGGGGGLMGVGGPPSVAPGMPPAPTSGVGMVPAQMQPFPPIAPPIMGPMGPMPFMSPGSLKAADLDNTLSQRMGMMGPGGPMPGGPPTMSAPHLQNKPLFPSAAAIASTANTTPTTNDFKSVTSTAPIGPVKPTFPAYSTGGGQGASASANSDPQKVPLINLLGGSSKIIHPPEDISLEEIKARLPKYQVSSGGIAADESVSSPALSNSSQANTPQSQTTVEEKRIGGVAARPGGGVSGLPPPPPAVAAGVPPGGGLLPPVSVAAIMAGGCPPLMRAPHPTIPIIPANMPLIRPPPMAIPGLIGGVMPAGGVMPYGAGPPVFPGAPMLAPMVPHPRFR